MSARLVDALKQAVREAGIVGCVQRVGSMFTLFFGIEAAESLADVERADREMFRRFFFGMLERGFYLPPSPFEAAFVSLAHSPDDIDVFVSAASETLSSLR
jgi:glutamate-1-semialdehyde 2,1-aminomutase